MRPSSLSLCLLAAWLPLVQATEQPIDFITTLVQTDGDSAFGALERRQHSALLARLHQDAHPFDQAGIDKIQTHAPLSNERWLADQGYDFQGERLQQADADLLAPFSQLPATVLDASTATVARINHAADARTQERALDDADGYPYLYFLADALGPNLGNAFLDAYDAGQLSKAAALIKASEVSTALAKSRFAYPRPFERPEQPVTLVADHSVVGDDHPYTAKGGAFPSGHTTKGYTDALLLAAMLPERAPALIARGAGYGYSRQVLGVHYPLDVIGGRMIAQYNVAQYLSDPAYRVLFDAASTELRQALAKACGDTLAHCAAPAAGAQDPWATPAAARFAQQTLTYGLPTHASPPSLQPAPTAVQLLQTLAPGLDEYTARTRLSQAQEAGEIGLDVSGAAWQRLDLLGALNTH